MERYSGPHDLQGILSKYKDKGVTRDDVERANPGVVLSVTTGLEIFIPYKCPPIMKKEEKFYMDSSFFKSPAIRRNGSLLLSFCYMDLFRRQDPKRCEEFFNYHRGFDKNANLIDWKQAANAAVIRQLTERPTSSYDIYYELRRYNLNGKIHYAVLDSKGHFYDPGRNVVTVFDAPDEIRYFEED
ncbi:hypothetical protein TVAG_083070 [Trichomonas vaginalis G3]|uniref:LysM domain-containing protein n=1 Tax=Trichomonas vaginalis (strain ATCC PRA-98 / G3) TaxID=412133 RepID=A2DM36_TRIV3|nr:hypothetical protein TVAGG3_0984300 [Trichomonas vaginalis G3]EAY18456.1 hypothetical protein TVAG_083070 [Trichomonas vaginalis G3]KAI5489555.1 hypothetical protein TVAGG3_0984300 [Trichomonas vaginalis G3]|eukprot:XP_001579442.1 hypothetical protein [Trichomonas vaginalis G3]